MTIKRHLRNGKPTLSITGVTILTAGPGFSSTLSEKEWSRGAGKGSVLLGGVRAAWKSRTGMTKTQKRIRLYTMAHVKQHV